VSKNAVVRNRVKRRLREICRAHGDEWRRGFDAVIVARAASAHAAYADLDAAVCALIVSRASLAVSVAATTKSVGET